MKSEFRTPLSGDWIDDEHFQLDKELVYFSELLNYQIIVPSSFETDFASVPRVPIAFWFFGDRAHHESVIHDYLYATGKVNKQLADKVFLEAMEVRGKNWFIRRSMYLGVVLGGWKAWRDHRKVE